MPRWAARCRKRRRSEFRTTNGEREVMPSPSAPMPDQRSSASAAGGEVHGEFGSRRQAAASGGGSAHDLTPLDRREAWGGAGGQVSGGRSGTTTLPGRQKVGGAFRSGNLRLGHRAPGRRGRQGRTVSGFLNSLFSRHS